MRMVIGFNSPAPTVAPLPIRALCAIGRNFRQLEAGEARSRVSAGENSVRNFAGRIEDKDEAEQHAQGRSAGDYDIPIRFQDRNAWAKGHKQKCHGTKSHQGPPCKELRQFLPPARAHIAQEYIRKIRIRRTYFRSARERPPNSAARRFPRKRARSIPLRRALPFLRAAMSNSGHTAAAPVDVSARRQSRAPQTRASRGTRLGSFRCRS
jgi:hypothetical protein